MKRSEKFKLVGWGVNCPSWIYQATFNRLDMAKKAFETFAGSRANFDSKEEVFYSGTNLFNSEKSAA